MTIIASPVFLIGVMACDYGRNQAGQQDGQTLGPHSRARLDGAIALAEASPERCPIFVCSADRLDPRHRRLCDLQREYLQERGHFNVIVPDYELKIWGTRAELQYLAVVICCLHELNLCVAVVTEHYHMYPRTTRLIQQTCDQLVSDTVHRVAVCHGLVSPSLTERVHEWSWLLVRYLPMRLQRNLSKRHRAGLRTKLE